MKKLGFRLLTALVAVLAVLSTVHGGEITKLDQDVRIYVMTMPGGAIDVRARAMAPHIARELGVEVTVENVTGGGGIVCMTQFVNQPRGDYDMMLMPSTILSCNPLFTEVMYRFEDILPVAGVDREEFGLYAVPSRSGIADFDDLAAYGKEKEIIYGSGGSGVITHVMQEVLYRKLGLKASTLPHNGAPEGLTNCMGGHNLVTLAGLETARSYVEAGSVTPILTFNPGDYTGYAGVTVPSVSRYATDWDNNYVSTIFLGLRSSVAPEIADFMTRAATKALKDEQCRADLRKVGAVSFVDKYGKDLVPVLESEIEKLKGWVN